MVGVGGTRREMRGRTQWVGVHKVTVVFIKKYHHQHQLETSHGSRSRVFFRGNGIDYRCVSGRAVVGAEFGNDRKVVTGLA